MAKYLYTLRVKKIVYYEEETIQVKAENEVIAKDLATKKAYEIDFEDVDKVKYMPVVVSYTCNPVEE